MHGRRPLTPLLLAFALATPLPAGVPAPEPQPASATWAMLASPAAAFAFPTFSASTSGSDEDDGAQVASAQGSLSSRVQQAVARAHAYLAEHQNKDGSFSLHRGRSASSAPVAVTGLATLSLLASGHLPQDGRYGRYGLRVKRAIDWLVDHTQRGGEHDGYIRDDGDLVSKMHGQGYALLALTQAVGMYGDNEQQRERLHDAIRRGIGLVQRTQGLSGGWFYEPERMAAHEGSITVCMVQALRAAKDAGFVVDLSVIEKADEYLAESQDEVTGRFAYALHDDRTSWALTAAALATMNALGDYDSPRLRNGFDALERDDPFLDGGRHEGFIQYGALYAAQAYWSHQDPRRFNTWWPQFAGTQLEEQLPDGSWQNGNYGQVYATAMVSLSLQVPFGLLPVFQR